MSILFGLIGILVGVIIREAIDFKERKDLEWDLGSAKRDVERIRNSMWEQKKRFDEEKAEIIAKARRDAFISFEFEFDVTLNDKIYKTKYSPDLDKINFNVYNYNPHETRNILIASAPEDYKNQVFTYRYIKSGGELIYFNENCVVSITGGVLCKQ